MKTPLWVDRRTVDTLHAASLSEHGGLEGIRDEGALESALARPVNLHMYEPDTDLARLAAAYGFGLARNHAFADGNKRIAFIVMTLFLKMNGQVLQADRVDAYHIMMDVADGSLDEEGFAEWIRAHSKKRKASK